MHLTFSSSDTYHITGYLMLCTLVLILCYWGSETRPHDVAYRLDWLCGCDTGQPTSCDVTQLAVLASQKRFETPRFGNITCGIYRFLDGGSILQSCLQLGPYIHPWLRVFPWLEQCVGTLQHGNALVYSLCACCAAVFRTSGAKH